MCFLPAQPLKSLGWRTSRSLKHLTMYGGYGVRSSFQLYVPSSLSEFLLNIFGRVFVFFFLFFYVQQKKAYRILSDGLGLTKLGCIKERQVKKRMRRRLGRFFPTCVRLDLLGKALTSSNEKLSHYGKSFSHLYPIEQAWRAQASRFGQVVFFRSSQSWELGEATGPEASSHRISERLG